MNAAGFGQIAAVALAGIAATIRLSLSQRRLEMIKANKQLAKRRAMLVASVRIMAGLLLSAGGSTLAIGGPTDLATTYSAINNELNTVASEDVLLPAQDYAPLYNAEISIANQEISYDNAVVAITPVPSYNPAGFSPIINAISIHLSILPLEGPGYSSGDQQAVSAYVSDLLGGLLQPVGVPTPSPVKPINTNGPDSATAAQSIANLISTINEDTKGLQSTNGGNLALGIATQTFAGISNIDKVVSVANANNLQALNNVFANSSLNNNVSNLQSVLNQIKTAQQQAVSPSFPTLTLGQYLSAPQDVQFSQELQDYANTMQNASQSYSTSATNLAEIVNNAQACAQSCIAAAITLEHVLPAISALPIIGNQLAAEYLADAQLLQQAGSLSQSIVSSGTQLQTTYTNYSQQSAYDSQLATQILALPTATVVAPASSNDTTQNFNSPVTAEQPTDVDPAFASGYIFRTGAGDPNFSTVTLASLQGLNETYTIQLPDGSTWLTVGMVDPLETFLFGPEGVDDFRVLLTRSMHEGWRV